MSNIRTKFRLFVCSKVNIKFKYQVPCHFWDIHELNSLAYIQMFFWFIGTRAGIAVSGRTNLKQGSMALPQQMQRTQLALMAAGATQSEINQQMMVIQQSAQMFTAGIWKFKMVAMHRC